MEKSNKKGAFLSYIYGYLNMVLVNQMNKPENISLEEYKIYKTGLYLGISQRLTFYIFKVLSYFNFLELFISLFIVVYRFFYCIITKVFTRKVIIDTKIITIGEGFPRQVELLGKTTLDSKEITVITVPFTSKNLYEKDRHISVLSILGYKDIVISLLWSIQLMAYLNRKYSKRDVLMRYYSSFDFFLAYIFSYKASYSYTFLFFSTYTRWAYLNGGLNNRKIFVQHGFLSGKWKLVKQIGRVDYAFYINEEQRLICEKMLFDNSPTYELLEGLKFTQNLPSDKKSVLIIGNNFYNEIEEDIIKKLSNNHSLLLLVKPHPGLKDDSFYHKMESQYGIVLLKKGDYPEVNYVFSYNSTLATQYEDAGIVVYRYKDDSFRDNLNRLAMINL